LKKFEQMIVREHLWGLFEQIKFGLSSYLSGQVGLISALSQLPVRILSNYSRKFEGILIRLYSYIDVTCMFGTLYFLQRFMSLQCLSSKSDDIVLRPSLQITAVTEDVKTTFSMVSVCAHASNTLWAALISTSAMNSCTKHAAIFINDVHDAQLPNVAQVPLFSCIWIFNPIVRIPPSGQKTKNHWPTYPIKLDPNNYVDLKCVIYIILWRVNIKGSFRFVIFLKNYKYQENLFFKIMFEWFKKFN
jgi:hypothetical protein